MTNCACLITTCNRARSLARTMPQVLELGAPLLVIDDGSEDLEQSQAICRGRHVPWLGMPENRGLAAALNVGLAYWLADKSIEWISYFQDDVDVHPDTLRILSGLGQRSKILSGHDAGEHASHRDEMIGNQRLKWKWAIRATHIHATADFWRSVLPIPTHQLGAPKRQGEGRGIGSNVDWWIVRDAPKSCQKTHQPVLVVPGLVRSFYWKAADSLWNNEQKAGEEPPLLP